MGLKRSSGGAVDTPTDDGMSWDESEWDDFGSNTSESDYSEVTQGNDDNNIWDEVSTPVDDTQQPAVSLVKQDSENSLGYKTVGLILAGILVVVAMVLILFSRIRVSKRQTSSTGTEVSVENTEGNPVRESSKSQTQTQASEFSELGNDVQVDYEAQVITSVGRVKAKRRYLYDNEVVHCLDITVDGVNLTYFCSYSAYSAVHANDSVTVDYMKVSDKYYVVDTIKK